MKNFRFKSSITLNLKQVLISNWNINSNVIKETLRLTALCQQNKPHYKTLVDAASSMHFLPKLCLSIVYKS